jgi:alkylation response protein AidB-like acyl-CoA dehydrogenase
MDLALNEEQEIIKKSAQNFLKKECPSSLVRELEEDEEGYSPDLWRKMAELGWMGLILPLDYGGSGGSFLDLAVLIEEMGKSCAPSWFFSTIVLGAQTIMSIGTEEQKDRMLSAISTGDSIGTLAFIEPKSGYEIANIQMTSKSNGSGSYLDGIKLFVPDAHIADWIICVVRGKKERDIDPDLELLLIDKKAPGISITPLKTISGDKLFEVKFDKVKLSPDDLLGNKEQSARNFETILQNAALAKCAEMVGGAQMVLDMSVDYAKQRVQFNSPIGSFQAIQHHLANMLIDLDCSRYLTYYAAWMLTEGIPCEKEVAMAKAFTSDAYINITTLGQQIHGGTGLIKEHDMQIYFRRAKSAALSLGNATYQRKMVAAHMGL